MKHSRKEIRHIQNQLEQFKKNNEYAEHNRRVRVNDMVVKAKVQNQLTMDNHERFKNIAFGFSIQASRLMSLVQSSQDVKQVTKAKNIMLKIQKQLIMLEKCKKHYDKHLSDSKYCKFRMQPFKIALDSIIKSVDLLMEKAVKNE